MPVLLGILIGNAFGRGAARIVMSHAFLTLVIWCAVTLIGGRIGYYNISPAAGYVTAVLSPAVLLAWTLWHPARSRAKLWMLDGLYVWARLCMFWFGGWAAVRLFASQWRLGPWIVSALPQLAAAAGCWALQRALVGLLVRSHRREGNTSLVTDE